MTQLPHSPLSHKDQTLLSEAENIIKRHAKDGKHKIGCAVQTSFGTIITAINLEGTFGCIDLCAEQIALGKFVSEHAGEIETLVAVRHPKTTEANQEIKVASPCGKCRELIFDYAPNAWVIVRDGSDIYKVKIADLLPFRYSKH